MAFRPLKEKAIAMLYLAEAISLLGDTFTWVGIALLANEFGGTKSAEILSIALTLRVVAFIVFSSYAGVLADRYDRKKILIITHFARMAIVACFPFIKEIWQIYLLIFLLNIFNAFFTPAYKSVMPQLIKGKENYASGIALSNGTWQLLGVLGPGLAGIFTVWMGARDLFFIDAFSFVTAALLLIFIKVSPIKKEKSHINSNIFNDIVKGSHLLFGNQGIRFALLIEFVAAIAGAQILVNTIG
jgi:NRE family putative nickel resistance protein-like MFS transporter